MNTDVMIGRDNGWFKKAINLYNVQIKIKELKDMEKQFMSVLIEASGNVNSRYKGIEFKLIEKKGVIKYSQIPAIKEIDLEPYRGEPYSYWRLHKKY